MNWIKLERGNDWGSIYLSRKALTENGTANARHRIEVNAGDTVKVRWPDGTVRDEKIVFERLHDSYTDHGQMHSTHVYSSVPGVETEANGIKMWVPLDELEVEENRFPVPQERT